MTKNILFACHRHPFRDQAGAEKSVSTIMRYFVRLGHNVKAIVIAAKDETIEGIEIIGGGLDYHIQHSDIVFTWGSVALNAAKLSVRHKVPYVLMVRWWRNVARVEEGVGDLMNVRIDNRTINRNKPIFDNAMAVVTNNYYSHDVIKKHYDRGALVSYVPIEGQPNKVNKSDGYITIVSPNKDLGEREIFTDIARTMQDRNFLVVNCPVYDVPHYNRFRNIKAIGQSSNMVEIWSQTNILLSPVYKNDVCGTTRVVIEAQQHGVPVIANDRCGMAEKVHNLVPYNASTFDWVRKIVEIEQNYDIESNAAIRVFEDYDTDKQLKVFSDLL